VVGEGAARWLPGYADGAEQTQTPLFFFSPRGGAKAAGRRADAAGLWPLEGQRALDPRASGFDLRPVCHAEQVAQPRLSGVQVSEGSCPRTRRRLSVTGSLTDVVAPHGCRVYPFGMTKAMPASFQGEGPSRCDLRWSAGILPALPSGPLPWRGRVGEGEATAATSTRRRGGACPDPLFFFPPGGQRRDCPATVDSRPDLEQ